MSKYGHRPIDWFEAVINRLGGEEMAEKLLQGKYDIHPVKKPNIKVWKRILLGTFQEALNLEQAVGEAFSSITATQYISLIPISPVRTGINLVALTVAELGFSQGTTYEWAVRAGVRFGLVKCPWEVGPQLRLQYINQPEHEDLYIAMDPVKGNHEFGLGNVFRLCVTELTEGLSPVLFTIKTDAWLSENDIVIFTTKNAVK